MEQSAPPAEMEATSAAPSPPSAASLLQLLEGALVARALHIVAELGIADVLKAGPKSFDEIAAAVGANVAALYRVLRSVTSVGVFTELVHQQFALTALGQRLRADVPGSLRPAVLLKGSEEYRRTYDGLRRQCGPVNPPLSGPGACRSSRTRTSIPSSRPCLIPADDGPSPNKVYDLVALALSGVEVRERTEGEFRTLFGAAGLTLSRVIPTDSRVAILEGVPA